MFPFIMAKVTVALTCSLIVVIIVLTVAQQGSANSGEYTNVRPVRRMAKGCALWGQACLGGHFKKRSNINGQNAVDMQDILYPWKNSPISNPPLFDDTDDNAAIVPVNGYPWNLNRLRRSVRSVRV